MKKLITMMMQETLNKQDGCLTIGLDLGDRSSFYCVLDEIEESLKLLKTDHLDLWLLHDIGVH